ncbi:MAG: hypothetical protein M3162_00250 [Thermoproteota archaeon]|nr:hypothetical protein [Thermoproteota archaeon]
MLVVRKRKGYMATLAIAPPITPSASGRTIDLTFKEILFHLFWFAKSVTPGLAR